MNAQAGEITIILQSCRYHAPPPPFPHLAPGEYLQLSIRDTGQGMSSDIKERIFDPFFSTKEIGKGTGLGLSVVHGIVQQSGASIAVESTPGQGTTFDIVFPVVNNPIPVQSPVAPPVKQPPAKKVSVGGKRVLFVDAAPESLKIPMLALKKLNYLVTTAAGSLQAFELFQKTPQQFDILITAQAMPGLTGLELCHKIRAIRPDIPIILYSDPDETVDSALLEAAGIGRSLHKPLKIRPLVQTIREILM